MQISFHFGVKYNFRIDEIHFNAHFHHYDNSGKGNCVVS